MSGRASLPSVLQNVTRVVAFDELSDIHFIWDQSLPNWAHGFLPHHQGRQRKTVNKEPTFSFQQSLACASENGPSSRLMQSAVIYSWPGVPKQRSGRQFPFSQHIFSKIYALPHCSALCKNISQMYVVPTHARDYCFEYRFKGNIGVMVGLDGGSYIAEAAAVTCVKIRFFLHRN